jgi:hypothetical protein
MSLASLTEQLRQAVQAVEDAKVPQDLRAAAFTRALDVLAGGGSPAKTSSATTPVKTRSGAQDIAPSAGEATARLAVKLGVDVATAEKVFDIDEDGLHLIVAPSKFGPTTKEAILQIARLVIAGRQAAGLDAEWTTSAIVRAATEDRGKADPGNFSAYIRTLDGEGFRIRGNGALREFKANAAGFERAGALVTELAA